MSRISAETIEKKLMIKAKAQNMEQYLNAMEKIFSEYSVGEQNTEKVTELSLITGKMMITFSDLVTMLGIYDE